MALLTWYPPSLWDEKRRNRAGEASRRGLFQQTGAPLASRLAPFFVKVTGGYQVSKAIRSCVSSPSKTSPRTRPSNLDLISCRNVLIYLQSRAAGSG